MRKLSLKYGKKILKPVVGLGSLLVGSAVLADAPDYTTLTSAVDFSTTKDAIISVAATLIVVYVAFKGAKLILSAVKGA